jgi:manganese/zinc/iron transport system substrate-binding protein
MKLLKTIKIWCDKTKQPMKVAVGASVPARPLFIILHQCSGNRRSSSAFQTIFLIFCLLLTACNQQTQKPINQVKITTTTTILKDLIEQIGGDKVAVTNLMGEGVDPHLYKASAGDIKKIATADLLVFGGLHLEGKMSRIFDNLANIDIKVLNVGNSLPKNKLIHLTDNVVDPHVWFDTDLFGLQAAAVSDKLQEIDPQNASFYQDNYHSYQQSLQKLTEDAQVKIKQIPPQQRILITAHDAFNYFAKQFGLTVKAVQGISTDAQAGTKDIAQLATFIANNKIKAIFIESSVPQKTIQALQEAVLAQNFNVVIGGELYADSLGDKPNNTETYIKTFAHNVDTIVNALK